jgi:nucleoside-diphosphate-sugar epimerase
MDSRITVPINLGSSEMVTINQLVSLAEEIAGIRCRRHYDVSAPKGVTGRNSDNGLIRSELGWEPSTTLRAGLEPTFAWIYDQVKAQVPA